MTSVVPFYNYDDICQYFGPYPYPEKSFMKYLRGLGVSVFVDLTCDGETTSSGLKLKPYSIMRKEKYINFPIVDRKTTPNMKEFRKLIDDLLEHIENGKTIYIHCRGGSGRAGTVVSCLLIHLFECVVTKKQ